MGSSVLSVKPTLHLQGRVSEKKLLIGDVYSSKRSDVVLCQMQSECEINEAKYTNIPWTTS